VFYLNGNKNKIMKKLSIIITFILSLSFNNIDLDYCKSIEEILKNKKVLNFLHLEDINRRTLFVSENKYCNFNKKILINLTIKTLSNQEIKSQKNIILIQNIEVIKKDEFKITIFYPIEGVFFEGHFINSKLFKIVTVEK
jgi:hypothetical protein